MTETLNPDTMVWASLVRHYLGALNAAAIPSRDRAELARLADYLDALTCATDTEAPDLEADGYNWTASHNPLGQSTVASEAHHAVYGPREGDYGHPREDFTRQAIAWTALLHHKLADGEHLEAADIARCMIAVKLCRDVHSPKRDNRVDMAGYAITLDRLETGR